MVVFASGVVLMLAGPSSRSALLPLHKISFIVWIVFTSLHVIGHLAELPRALRAAGTQPGGRQTYSSDPAARAGSFIALSGVVVAGTVLAIVYLPQFGPWLHAQLLFKHH